MLIPMVKVFKPDQKGQDWEAVAEPIDHSDKLEWFENLEDWPIVHQSVLINGKIKECDVYLTTNSRGWVKWNDFQPPLLS